MTFQWFVAQIEYARPLKSASKLRISSFVPPSKILGGTIARFRTHDFTKELHTRVLNQAILTHFFSIISVSIVVWPDCRVLTHASSFVKVVGAKSRSFCSPYHTAHVGNSICETYPRMIGQGLNEAACILGSMLSSLMGLPNQAWVSLANVAPTWHAASATCHYESVRSIF